MSEHPCESPRIVLYLGRGGYMRCGEFMYFESGDRILVKTNPGGSVPNTSIKESSKLSPEQACEQHNRLLERVQTAEAENKRLQTEVHRLYFAEREAHNSRGGA